MFQYFNECNLSCHVASFFAKNKDDLTNLKLNLKSNRTHLNGIQSFTWPVLSFMIVFNIFVCYFDVCPITLMNNFGTSFRYLYSLCTQISNTMSESNFRKTSSVNSVVVDLVEKLKKKANKIRHSV